ncbi:MAG TPA: polysaccharide deacetylase family protein [Usitatibacter sp.]|jgi:peptidoglycan/xylan/chitin deacetylase (PgdA/CDA1 family)|nr:polysaccharide deacetylase family protein [Usitatibacter sp.]
MSAALPDPRLRERWRPAPLVAASIGLHGLAGLTALAAPESWAWAAGAVAANHGVLGMAGMWPRGSLLGPNMTHLPEASRRRGEIAITLDDGPDPEVTPRVLDLLEARGCRATFFCIAECVREHTALCREIARRGHAVENHSMAHRGTFPLLTLGGFRREIAGAQSAIAEATGTAPRFFRPPAGLRNPLLDPALHEAGLTLVTWTRRGFDTRERDAERVAARLLRGLAAGDILLLHDGHAARAPSGAPVVLEALPRVLDAAEAAGLHPVTLPRAIEP